MLRDSGNVCVITGAATGIGAATAEVFAARGWQVLISYYPDSLADDARALAERCAAIGPSPVIMETDVGDDDACRALARHVEERWGRVDALVNAAGTTRFIPHADLDGLDADEFQRVYRVNVIGAYQAIRALTPLLRQSPGAGIVNISSVAGERGTGSSMAYAASKGALNTLTRSLARVLAPAIRVNAIAPGFVDGGLPGRVLDPETHDRIRDQQRRAAPLERYASPAEIADLIHVLAARSPGLTGQIITPDNGLSLTGA